ncbi:uncharacterized protein LOC129178763 isoform X1 [Dunckerocampus dactyliophorus]|uniref:uncharacterized protein LOC129178763 isoform X1 n=1 Tax=Dunckerocampus dactyliophorus TaxID=161453 RepID=UPI0024053773|nr:uncharacterized protein LOC129178763 isoform X1 [Dunckerocampus dactyliophorus]
MAAPVAAVLLILAGSVGSGVGSGPDLVLGQVELGRVRSLAKNSKYGECWARALGQLDEHCREMTSERQGRLALKFTHCHLSSSGRDFPSCPKGSEVSRCTASMDSVAFNTYTEFFTHTYAICHFLQSEAWHNRAENTMHRLTESSAGVVEQLESTKHMAEELMEAQSVALQAQHEILNSGEELRVTLRDSTQGLRSMFSELSSVSREQQVVLSELFSRVSFLQNFLMMETHSVTSCLYNAAALCASFLLTSTQRSSRARLVLLGLVCMNFYLERKIYHFVMTSDHPEHTMELVGVYIGMLRRFMVGVAFLVLLWVCVRYMDPGQQSLLVLQQLRDTHCRLQETLQRAENFGQWKKTEDSQVEGRRKETLERTKGSDEDEEGDTLVSPSTDTSDLSRLSIIGWSSDGLLSSTLITTATDTSAQPVMTHDASMTPGRRTRRRSSFSSPVVYSVLVEDKQPRYSLRSRKSQNL